MVLLRHKRKPQQTKNVQQVRKDGLRTETTIETDEESAAPKTACKPLPTVAKPKQAQRHKAATPRDLRRVSSCPQLSKLDDQPERGFVNRAKDKQDEANKIDAPAPVQEWFDSIIKKGVDGLRREYLTVRSYVPPNGTTEAFHKHATKNRYKDVVCLDQTRVKLTDGGDDYIHASYVDGYSSSRQYICTQGPLAETIGDFWRLIWQERPPAILMLCRFMEQGKEKCAEYMPLNEGESKTYLDMTVRHAGSKQEYLAGGVKIAVSTLEVQRRGEKIEVRHWLFSDWPDQGVLKDPRAALKLVKRVQSSGYPTVVHCSAGIGRTGTLVTMDICMTALVDNQFLDVRHRVLRMRDQRMHVIQTDRQYLFLHRALLHFITLRWRVPDTTLFDEFCLKCESL